MIKNREELKLMKLPLGSELLLRREFVGLLRQRGLQMFLRRELFL